MSTQRNEFNKNERTSKNDWTKPESSLPMAVLQLLVHKGKGYVLSNAQRCNTSHLERSGKIELTGVSDSPAALCTSPTGSRRPHRVETSPESHS